MTTRTVQFTGNRTGRSDLVVPRYGRIHLGDVVELPVETAKAWTRLLPTADGEAADFAYLDAVPLQEDPSEEDLTEADVTTPADDDEADRPADPADIDSAADSAESEGDTL